MNSNALETITSAEKILRDSLHEALQNARDLAYEYKWNNNSISFEELEMHVSSAMCAVNRINDLADSLKSAEMLAASMIAISDVKRA